MISGIAHRLATANGRSAQLLRRLRREVRTFTLPVPMIAVRPIVWVFLSVRRIWYSTFRLLICEPFFKAACTSYGRGVRTDVYLHWIQGAGRLIVGDGVLMDGKSSITFASRYTRAPTLEIGDGTGVGHGCMFTIGKRITIGRCCRIAAGVWMFDSSGHPTAPEERLLGCAAPADEVRPISVGDNVWIGGRSIIHPGVTIGAHSVVSAGSVVMTDVPTCTVVAGNPARRIRILTQPGERLTSSEERSDEPVEVRG